MARCAYKGCRKGGQGQRGIVLPERAKVSNYCSTECAFDDDTYQEKREAIPGSIEWDPATRTMLRGAPVNGYQTEKEWAAGVNGHQRTNAKVYSLCLMYGCPYDSTRPYGSYEALRGYAEHSKRKVRRHILGELEKAMRQDMKPASRAAEAVETIRKRVAVFSQRG